MYKSSAFLSWFEEVTQDSIKLGENHLRGVATAFNLSPPADKENLLQLLEESLTRFEAHINNVADNAGPSLSMQGAPVDLLIESVKKLEVFADKLFFFLIDEYENLEDYQQRLMNTLIKHSGELYSFKICVRELGWRVHNTTTDNEYLISPADYTRIDITQEMQNTRFEEFSHKVCQDRLAALIAEDSQAISEIKGLLPSMSEEKEALALGIDDHNQETYSRLWEFGPAERVERLTPMEIYLLAYWAKCEKQDLSTVFEDYKQNKKRWQTRLDNYRHALLFTNPPRKNRHTQILCRMGYLHPTVWWKHQIPAAARGREPCQSSP